MADILNPIGSPVGGVQIVERYRDMGDGTFARVVSDANGGGGGGSGDVVGPASATADALALFNGTTGKLLKNGGTLADALAALGVYPAALTAPLIIQWDFSAPMSVGINTGVSRIFARQYNALGIGATNGWNAGDPAPSLDPLYSDVGNDWSANGQFPNADSINGLSVWKQTETSEDRLRFTFDAPNIRHPDLFFVFKLTDPATDAARAPGNIGAIYGANSLDYPCLHIKDVSGTLRWCVDYDISGTVTRTTAAAVDTDAHVICLPLRGDQSLGIWMDGVFYPWTNAAPGGWDDHTYIYGITDIFLWGTDNLQGAQTSGDGPQGLCGEARIYNALTDAERAAVTAELMSKWGITA